MLTFKVFPKINQKTCKLIQKTFMVCIFIFLREVTQLTKKFDFSQKSNFS